MITNIIIIYVFVAMSLVMFGSNKWGWDFKISHFIICLLWGITFPIIIIAIITDKKNKKKTLDKKEKP